MSLKSPGETMARISSELLMMKAAEVASVRRSYVTHSFLQPWGSYWNKRNTLASNVLTVIRRHEGDVVDVVLDVRRLPVQDGDGGNATVDRVDLQPVGRVVHLGVPWIWRKGEEEEEERRSEKPSWRISLRGSLADARGQGADAEVQKATVSFILCGVFIYFFLPQ